MFISVDLPAPFSPSSACTSPLRRSRSTWSLATTPGNRFVMPAHLENRRVVHAGIVGAGPEPRRTARLLDATGSWPPDLDLAEMIFCLQLVHLAIRPARPG